MKSTLFKLSLLLFLLFMTTSGFAAQGEDWVLVERFKTQLEQAKNGKVSAMYQVGLLFERGRGTEKDMQQAAKWFQQAADAGNSSARGRLGIMYVEGRGVKRNLDKALSLLSQAAEDNIASAQYQLASMYEQGTGVATDINAAIKWYRLAAKNGYYRANQKVAELGNGNAPAATRTPAKKTVNTASSKTLKLIHEGNWFRRNQPSNYLPSGICSCRENNHQLNCISTAQERDTGSEIITYNTESNIRNFSRKGFDIEYVNNVLEVELHEIVNEDGEMVMPTSSSVKTGKQEKTHVLNCVVKNENAVTCTKNGMRKVELVNRK